MIDCLSNREKFVKYYKGVPALLRTGNVANKPRDTDMIKTATTKSGVILFAMATLSGSLAFISNAAAAESGALTLVSSDAAGKLQVGLTSPCAISADGSQVVFNSTASGFVRGDTNNSNDVFLKNVRTGAISRISTTSSGGQIPTGAECQGMAADGTTVVLKAKTSPNSADTNFVPGSEPALFVKNLQSGSLQRISPPLATLPTTSDYVFRSISDDGTTVAFVTTPTSTYLGPYSFRPDGPFRTLVVNVTTGQLSDWTDTIKFTIGGVVPVAIGTLVLSSDGSLLAFDSSVDHPAAGDNNGGSDAFVLDLRSGVLSLASTDRFGQQNVFTERTFGVAPSFKVARFIGDNLALYVPRVSSLGAEGYYFKNLTDHSLSFILPTEAGIQPRDFAAPVSFSADGSKVAFTRRGTQDSAIVRDTQSGQEQLAAVTSTGVVGNNSSRFPFLSNDGNHVLFESNATNLSRAKSFELYVKTLTH
ncbi:hypothetical protein [Methylocucumis oryzae]|uniref:Uncharacterized protein n=1 Tax=Methylocucumis oryzae TaxID=1632867 RepID=A0A0F3IEM0_9GAMM|nr:hypothetical protein [Methylocucumis oryzae]KJV05255.1 hypothetical protein VZ94_19510 [Methylocucumis oryzae]